MLIAVVTGFRFVFHSVADPQPPFSVQRSFEEASRAGGAAPARTGHEALASAEHSSPPAGPMMST